ncbi:MAG: hypothetical protein ACTS4U_01270 [Candidatus Hodgkinia cicadicola]
MQVSKFGKSWALERVTFGALINVIWGWLSCKLDWNVILRQIALT